MNHRPSVKLLVLACLLGFLSTGMLGQDVTVKVQVDTINGKVPLALAHLWGQTIRGLTPNDVVYEMAGVEI
jgi:hypothetical protein